MMKLAPMNNAYPLPPPKGLALHPAPCEWAICMTENYVV